MSEKIEPKPGDIWRENDKRIDRYIRVLWIAIGGRYARVKTCSLDGAFPKGAREGQASLRRFNGKPRGYSFVRRA
jgi:hypothetical protein